MIQKSSQHSPQPAAKLLRSTNNGSERKLRPCVIQRKVTNGYRAMWAAHAEADVRTTIDTARLRAANPFEVILATLA